VLTRTSVWNPDPNTPRQASSVFDQHHGNLPCQPPKGDGSPCTHETSSRPKSKQKRRGRRERGPGPNKADLRMSKCSYWAINGTESFSSFSVPPGLRQSVSFPARKKAGGLRIVQAGAGVWKPQIEHRLGRVIPVLLVVVVLFPTATAPRVDFHAIPQDAATKPLSKRVWEKRCSPSSRAISFWLGVPVSPA